MSIKFGLLALGVFALALPASSTPSHAGPGCSPYYHHRPCSPPVYHGTQHCYYLPTVANGRVTGVEQVCNWY